MSVTPQNAYQTPVAGRIREDEVITYLSGNLTSLPTGNTVVTSFQAKELPQAIEKEFLSGDPGVGKRASWREPNLSNSNINGYNKGS